MDDLLKALFEHGLVLKPMVDDKGEFAVRVELAPAVDGKSKQADHFLGPWDFTLGRSW